MKKEIMFLSKYSRDYKILNLESKIKFHEFGSKLRYHGRSQYHSTYPNEVKYAEIADSS